MKIRYFAWVRERIGKPEETVDPPPGVSTIAELITWLRSRGPEYEAAFAETDCIRAAIDMTHVDHSARVTREGEIAFFPPVTGG